MAAKKRCSRCEKLLAATRENFHADKRTKDGLRDACKACRNASVRPVAREYARRNKKKTADYQSIYYQTVTAPRRQAERNKRKTRRRNETQ